MTSIAVSFSQLPLASANCRWLQPIAVGFSQLPLASANGSEMPLFPWGL